MADPHLVVTGMMGAGKTTTATALSRRLGLPMRDSDHDIEAGAHRRTIAPDELAAIDERRRPLFEQVADVPVDGRLPVAEVVDAAVARLGQLESRRSILSSTR